MGRKFADVKVEMTVWFDDDDTCGLLAQAVEAAEQFVRTPGDEGCECGLIDAACQVVGVVRDTELPAQDFRP